MTDPIVSQPTERTKVCNGCGEELPRGAFHPKRNQGPNGRHYLCKRCDHADHAERYRIRYRTDPAFAEAERERRRRNYERTGR